MSAAGFSSTEAEGTEIHPAFTPAPPGRSPFYTKYSSGKLATARRVACACENCFCVCVVAHRKRMFVSLDHAVREQRRRCRCKELHRSRLIPAWCCINISRQEAIRRVFLRVEEVKAERVAQGLPPTPTTSEDEAEEEEEMDAY